MEQRPSSPTHRTAKDLRIRRLALMQLCEMRRAGMRRREIRLRLGIEDSMGPVVDHGDSTLGLPSEPLPGPVRSGGSAAGDRLVFLRALDGLDQGIAFFDGAGRLLHANRSLLRALEQTSEGGHLRQEVQHFAASLCGLVRLRGLAEEDTVEELAVRELRTAEAHYRLKGGYIGLDLFGQGGSVLVTLERPAPEPLSDEALRERFGLTKQERRILRLLIEGRRNEEIARTLFVSPHTIRTHLMRIFRKLAVHSRSEVTAKVLHGGASSPSERRS